MTQRENILQELNELKSSLSIIDQPGYRVPDGYFDNLVGVIIKKIKAAEPANTRQELEEISPLLNSISKTNPYSVPQGYFSELSKSMEGIPANDANTAGTEEPAFAFDDLRRKSTYTVPSGYFENLSTAVNRKIKGAEIKVVPLVNRKWLRYAAAATVIAFVAMFTFVLTGKKNVNPDTKSYAWVEKNLKKVSTDDITEFVELVTLENPDLAKLDTREEISSLLKDVSDKEIADFLNDTQPGDTGSDEDQILN